MADQQLKIRLDVIDNASKAFTDVKNSIFNLRNALAGLGAGLAIKSLVNIGSQAELTRNKLSFLFGSVEKGSQAFNTLTTYASKAPFAFEDIVNSANNLAVVSKTTDDLSKNLQIVGNVASITGLDFQTTAEQLSKAFTKGINSARLFQDKGVASLLGFSQNAEISAFQTEEAFNRVFGAGGRFSSATDVLSSTFEGTLKKLTNTFTKFQTDINKAGFFDFLKAGLDTVNNLISKNSKTFQDFSNTISQTLINATKGILLGTGLIIDAISPIFTFVASGIQGLLTIVDSLPRGIREIGIIGFLLLGTGGKFLALAIGSLLDQQKKFVEQYSKQKFFLEENNSLIEKETGAYGAIKDFLSQIDVQQKTNIENQKITNDLIDGAGQKLKNNVSLLDDIINKFTELNSGALNELNKTSDIVAQTLNQGIKDFSKGIAESIILGKSLGEALKSAVQNALVRILASQIEIIIREGIKLSIQKLQTAEILKQNALLAQQQSMGGGGSGLFGSLLKIGASFFGGSTFDSAGINTTLTGTDGSFAEGGSVRGGMPITVGERGRELFIPSSNGSIVPNQDLGGANNITFNIQANDVRGIKELLIDNRATIINLVNQGANAKGRSNVV
jgi:hypothetical protein